MSAAHAIETALVGIVVCSSAAIAAPLRSAPPGTVTGLPSDSELWTPPLHLMSVDLSSPQPAQHATIAGTTSRSPLMCAQRTHSQRKLHQNCDSPKVGPRKIRPVFSWEVKTLADMHVAPALRRWIARLGLALVVAILIGYLPGEALRRNPRALKLAAQVHQLEGEAKELAAGNAALAREIEALRTDVGAIEDRARADLGMVYPDEIVLRVNSK